MPGLKVGVCKPVAGDVATVGVGTTFGAVQGSPGVRDIVVSPGVRDVDMLGVNVVGMDGMRPGAWLWLTCRGLVGRRRELRAWGISAGGTVDCKPRKNGKEVPYSDFLIKIFKAKG